jgi:hypothetical protein
MTTKALGVRVAAVSLLAALALVLLGFAIGQHGFADIFASLILVAGLLTGTVMWCVGWLADREKPSSS